MNKDNIIRPTLSVNPRKSSYIPQIPKGLIIVRDTREQLPYSFNNKIPYIDKAAQQEEILSRESSQSLEPSDVFSYQSMLDQFELQGGLLEGFELDKEAEVKPELEIKPGGMVLDFD